MTGDTRSRLFSHPLFKVAMAVLSILCAAPATCSGGGGGGGSGSSASGSGSGGAAIPPAPAAPAGRARRSLAQAPDRAPSSGSGSGSGSGSSSGSVGSSDVRCGRDDGDLHGAGSDASRDLDGLGVRCRCGQHSGTGEPRGSRGLGRSLDRHRRSSGKRASGRANLERAEAAARNLDREFSGHQSRRRHLSGRVGFRNRRLRSRHRGQMHPEFSDSEPVRGHRQSHYRGVSVVGRKRVQHPHAQSASAGRVQPGRAQQRDSFG